MNTWYFVMTDNRRIGIDLDLYRKASADGIVPLTRQELANRIVGTVTTSQKEYMSLVNELIFGFDNIDIYDDLIKLLIQLRRPKLSKDFKPTVTYDILQQSLPALKDDDLHSVADTLEQIDQARQQLDQAKEEYRLMTGVTEKYDRYRDYCIREIACHLNETAGKLRADQKQLEQTVQDHSALKEKLLAYEEEARQLNITISVLTRERDELRQHEVFRLVNEKTELVRIIKDQSARLDSAEEKMCRKQNQIDELKRQIEEKEIVLDQLRQEMNDLKTEMNDLSTGAGFSEHPELAGDYERLKENYDFHFWKQKIKDYAGHLREVQNLFKELKQKKEDVRREDQRLGEQTKKVADLDMEARHWRQTCSDERDRLEIELQKWRESVHFTIDETHWADVLQNVGRLYDEVTLFDDALKPARDSMQSAEKIYRMQDAEWAQKLKSEQQQKKKLEEQKAEWLAKKDPEPERTDEMRSFRESLRDREIPARPLYELIDFAKDTPQPVQNNLEAALLEAGYLDALVSEQELELSADKQLKPEPLLFAQTLSQFLVPDCPPDSGISNPLFSRLLIRSSLKGRIR
ncbi:hypothetical protein EWI07_01300 [Sporolactobacillus sp. THM7-4]|nr:hypothetical protein EWI07_01300 [Sporolactobacillus sp. THM7-4]